MPGYKLKVKGDYARLESLLCPYCSDILKEAIQTESGFRLCQSCFDYIQKDLTVLKDHKDYDDLKEIEKDEPYHPDKAVRREVNKIPVYCENQDLGCAWSGKLGDHESDHKQVCQYKSEECPNGCGEKLLIEKMDNHLETACRLRNVQCQYCDKDMLALDLKAHLQHCPNAPYTCKSCSKVLSQTDKDKHLMIDCDKLLQCAACKIEIPRDQIGNHLSDPTKVFIHQQQLALQLQNSESKIIQKLDDLTHTVYQNESIVTKNVTEVKDLSQELQTMKESVQIMSKELQAINKDDFQLIVNELLKRVRALEDTTASQSQTIQMLQNRPVGQGFPSSAPPLGLSDDYPSDRLDQLEGKIAETDRQLAVSKVNISELELQLQASLASTYNGSFLWRIPDIKRRRRDALEGKITSIYSPPFYTGRNGYKMCVRAYLNGDGIGYNTHLSIFFVLMKGEYDPLLKWPFDYKVSLILVDQDHRRHIVQTFKPSPSSSSFQKPKSDMNIASGCPKFAELKVLDNESYVKDDVTYIKCIVDTQRIYHP